MYVNIVVTLASYVNLYNYLVWTTIFHYLSQEIVEYYNSPDVIFPRDIINDIFLRMKRTNGTLFHSETISHYEFEGERQHWE